MAINEYLKIGVLGGMGPEASVAFYNRIIKLFQQEQGAKHNFEYPEMLIHNMPSPDNVEAGVEDELADYLLNSTRMLEQAGMQLLAIPCNSAHVHIDKVMAAVQGKVMNILEETAKAVHQSGLRKVLLLATKSTLKYEIYQSYLKDLGIETIVPSQAHQEITTQAIMSVCGGSINSTTRSAMVKIVEAYPDAQGVVLGCTEIPLIIGQEDLQIPCFDTAEILARATYEHCLNK